MENFVGKPPNTVTIQLSLRNLLAMAACLLLLWGLYLVRDVLFLLALVLLFSSALYPIVDWLKRRRWPTIVSILSLFLIFVALMALTAYLVGNLLLTEGQQFLAQLPGSIDATFRLFSHLLSQASWLRHIPGLELNALSNQATWLQQMSQHTEMITSQVSQLALTAFSQFFGLFSGVLTTLTVFALTAYLLTDVPYFERVMTDLLPVGYRQPVRALMREMAFKLGAYVRGQLLLMAIVGLLVGVGLSLIGINNAPILGLITFLLEIIPILGPIVSAILAIIVTLGQAPQLAIWVALLFLVIQQSESYFLTPKIFSSAVELRPFWIIVSILVASSLAGLPGVVLAVPSAVVVRLLIKRLYLESNKPSGTIPT